MKRWCPSALMIFSPSISGPINPRGPKHWHLLDPLYAFHPGLSDPSTLPSVRVCVCGGRGVQPRILRLSDGHLRGSQRERSAVHLTEDYPLKGRDGDGDWGEKENKKDVLKRWIWRGRVEGVMARTVREMEREKKKVNHMEIKCVWERVNRKSEEGKAASEGNV